MADINEDHIDLYAHTDHNARNGDRFAARVEEAAVGTGVLNPARAAALLGMSPRTLRAHVRAGNIACVRLGLGERRPRRGFLPDDLIAFMARLRRTECPTEGTHRTARVGDACIVSTFTQRHAAGRRGSGRGRSRSR